MSFKSTSKKNAWRMPGKESMSYLMMLSRICFFLSLDHARGSLHSNIDLHVAAKWFQRRPELLTVPIQIQRKRHLNETWSLSSHMLLPVSVPCQPESQSIDHCNFKFGGRVDLSQVGRAYQARE